MNHFETAKVTYPWDSSDYMKLYRLNLAVFWVYFFCRKPLEEHPQLQALRLYPVRSAAWVTTKEGNWKETENALNWFHFRFTRQTRIFQFLLCNSYC